MIEDGHFKELKYILDFIYTKRVDFKKSLSKKYGGGNDNKKTLLNMDEE